MQVGALVGNFGTFGEDPGVHGCLAIADAAERLGYDSVWVHDHVVMPSNVTSRYLYTATGESPFRADQCIYDPLAVMAAIAARTERVRIGTSVLIVPYRNPLVLAKTLATIDRISHGRVTLGIGVGWMAEEFAALGIAELWAERGQVTDEYVAVCIDLWTQQGPSSFSGRYVDYADVGANPRPVQRPHIPIWVGGKTKPAMRRVARYGSGYHSVASTPAELRDEVAAVRAEVARAGRDPDEIVVSMLAAFIAPRPPGEMVDLIGEYREAGLQHLVGVPSTRPGERSAGTDAEQLAEAVEDLERFASEVLPAVR